MLDSSWLGLLAGRLLAGSIGCWLEGCRWLEGCWLLAGSIGCWLEGCRWPALVRPKLRTHSFLLLFPRMSSSAILRAEAPQESQSCRLDSQAGVRGEEGAGCDVGSSPAQLTKQLECFDPTIVRFAPVLCSELGLESLEVVALLSDADFCTLPSVQSAGFSPAHLQKLREAARRWTVQNGWKREEKEWYISLLIQLHAHATYAGEQGNPIMALLFRGLRGPFSIVEAMKCIENKYVDYLCGVDIKMELDDPRKLDGSSYDKAHGEGLFKQIMSRMRSPPIRYVG